MREGRKREKGVRRERKVKEEIEREERETRDADDISCRKLSLTISYDKRNYLESDIAKIFTIFAIVVSIFAVMIII